MAQQLNALVLTPLKTYLEQTKSSQNEFAERIGVIQSAVSAMLVKKRHVFVYSQGDEVRTYEIRGVHNKPCDLPQDKMLTLLFEG